MICTHSKDDHYLVFLDNGGIGVRCRVCRCDDVKCAGTPDLLEHARRMNVVHETGRQLVGQLMSARDALDITIGRMSEALRFSVSGQELGTQPWNKIAANEGGK